jgi:cytidyltransferase-like protein
MPIKIVYTYVVADLLHMGHVLYLENAKNLVSSEGKLIVGVLTDQAVMEKKPKPILPFSERMRLVQALKCVDIVVPQETYSPISNIEKIKPDIVMESESHSEKDLEEIKNLIESFGGRVIVMPYYPEQSSSRIKENILDDWKNEKNDTQ